MTGCWIWHGGWGRDGYGVLWGGHTLGKAGNILAHRVAWLLHRGAIPDGMCVLHKCDNRACVNPDHLFLGTPQENTDDMMRKGRCPTGERAHLAKLRDKDVLEIRGSTLTGAELSKKYGISVEHAYAVRSGKRQGHIQ